MNERGRGKKHDGKKWRRRLRRWRTEERRKMEDGRTTTETPERKRRQKRFCPTKGKGGIINTHDVVYIIQFSLKQADRVIGHRTLYIEETHYLVQTKDASKHVISKALCE